MIRRVEFTRGLAAATLALSFACSSDDPSARDASETDGGVGVSKDDVTTSSLDDDAGDPSDGEGSAGPGEFDCSPAWTTPWIGSPCSSSTDCSFAGGLCLSPSEGFPCGTCSRTCTTTCPATDDAPSPYCIHGGDLGLDPSGYCLSRCDVGRLGGNGCRDGYACEVLDGFDPPGSSGVCIPSDLESIDFEDEEDEIEDEDPLVEAIDHAFLIQHFGGFPANPFDFGPDLDSFQLYLDAVGVQHTTAEQVAAPHNPSAAAGCGLTILLPEREHWPKIGALGLFTDVLTELVGEPIYMRNWWRPPCYNAAVGGAATGDHPDADAVDLDFASTVSRAEAQKFLCEHYWNRDIVGPEEIAPGAMLDPRLNMSVGLGGVTIHLGVLSTGGRRFWKYATYSDLPDSGTCW